MIKIEILITVGTGLVGQFRQIESALRSAREPTSSWQENVILTARTTTFI